MMISIRNLKRLFAKTINDPGYALTVLDKRARSLFSYYFSGGFSSYPETISLFLTYNCNLRCKMCGYWGATKERPREDLTRELSLNELKNVIDDVSSFKPNITLFGGEPFLYKSWLPLVKYVKQSKLRCNVVTNGVLLKEKSQELLTSGLDEIIFSLQGPRDIHDSITKTRGSFDAAIAAFTAIRNEKKINGLKKPHINVACTLCEDNYKYMEEIISISASIGVESITFHHLCFINSEILAKNNQILKRHFDIQSSDWAGFLRKSLPQLEVDYLIERINKIKRKRYPLDVSFYPNYREEEIRRYYTNFEFSADSYKNRCLSPWITAYIFPDGSVGPCEEQNIYFGNVKKESFSGIWNNRRFVRFRQILKKENTFPVCAHCTELYRF